MSRPCTRFASSPKSPSYCAVCWAKIVDEWPRVRGVQQCAPWPQDGLRRHEIQVRNPPTEHFRLLLLLPAKPNNGADTTRLQLGCLLEADHGAGRLLAVTIHSHNPSSTDALYVHAKVAIVDDRWLTVGSANLNEHSLFNDTEINIATCDPVLARHTRLALWAEHLHRTVEQIDHDPTTVIDQLWRPIAEEQLNHKRNGLALTRRLMQLPSPGAQSASSDRCEACSSTANTQAPQYIPVRGPPAAPAPRRPQ
jgi:hypothetical protein